jgi:hypothetical protein
MSRAAAMAPVEASQPVAPPAAAAPRFYTGQRVKVSYKVWDNSTPTGWRPETSETMVLNPRVTGDPDYNGYVECKSAPGTCSEFEKPGNVEVPQPVSGEPWATARQAAAMEQLIREWIGLRDAKAMLRKERSLITPKWMNHFAGVQADLEHRARAILNAIETVPATLPVGVLAAGNWHPGDEA